MNTRKYILPLPMYRQGDDFQSCLEWAKHDLPLGLRTYAEGLMAAVDSILELADFVQDHVPDAIAYGEGHTIHVEGHEDALDQLIAPQILSPDTDEDTEEWCCQNCGCELSSPDTDEM